MVYKVKPENFEKELQYGTVIGNWENITVVVDEFGQVFFLPEAECILDVGTYIEKEALEPIEKLDSVKRQIVLRHLKERFPDAMEGI